MTRVRSSGKQIVTRCCGCQKIRNAAGEWQDLGKIRLNMKQTLFSHSVCPTCLINLYPEFVSAQGVNL